MKTLITTLALAAFVVASAAAIAAPVSSTQVIVNGKVVGQDPDANIRGALMRDPYPVGD